VRCGGKPFNPSAAVALPFFSTEYWSTPLLSKNHVFARRGVKQKGRDSCFLQAMEKRLTKK